MAYEVQKVNSLGANTPTLMTFTAAGALAKGALCGFSGGKLTLCTGANVTPVCVTLQSAAANGDAVLCELLGPNAIISAHCTASVAVGGVYDMASSGLEIDAADTTNVKVLVLSYDSATGYAEALPAWFARA